MRSAAVLQHLYLTRVSVVLAFHHRRGVFERHAGRAVAEEKVAGSFLEVVYSMLRLLCRRRSVLASASTVLA